MSTLSLTAETAEMRVDKYLAEEIEFLSRSKVQESIRNNQVLVNGNPVKPSYILEGGEIIQIELPDPEPLEVAAEDIWLDVIYEDDLMIVVNKPARMVTHPGAGNFYGTLVNALVFHFDRLSRCSGPLRPGIVHRLDKDTSGVIVVARSDESHSALSEQFSNRTVEKKYLGLVWGSFEETEGIIDKPLLRHPTKRNRFATGSSGRPAITMYKVIEKWDYVSLLEFTPKTGRTHQIRVHMASIHHPIFADHVYGGGKGRIAGYAAHKRRYLSSLFSLMSRQALHALSLSLNHPKTGNRVTFTAPLAKDFQMLLDRLRETRE